MFLLFQELEVTKVRKQPLLYCHFTHISEKPSYTPVTDGSKLRTTLTDALESYNDLHPEMNLVLFEDAIHHV